MIGKKYLIENRDAFGNKPWDIEGFEEAIKDETELWVVHHVLEWVYSSEELKNLNRYDIVPASDLIWVRYSVHAQNEALHKGLRVYKKDKISIARKGKKLSKEHVLKISEGNRGK